MENLTVSLSTTLYMMLVMLIGRMVFRKIPDREIVIAQIDKMVFSIFLPMMAFRNIYTTDLKTAFDAGLLLYMLAVLCTIWLILMVLMPRWIPNRRTCGAFIQGTIRSNAMIFGLSVISELFAGQDLGCPTILSAFTTVGFNLIGVITLEVYRGQRPDPRKIVQNILKNPVLIAGASAVLLVVLDIHLPFFMERTVNAMANMASPMGILLIGASLQMGQCTCKSALAASVLMRLVIIPAIGVTGAALLGWRGIELYTVLIIMATPTAVASYSMAQVMNSDGVFAANQVGMSSLLGAGTIFLWTAVLNFYQLL